MSPPPPPFLIETGKIIIDLSTENYDKSPSNRVKVQPKVSLPFFFYTYMKQSFNNRPKCLPRAHLCPQPCLTNSIFLKIIPLVKIRPHYTVWIITFCSGGISGSVNLLHILIRCSGAHTRPARTGGCALPSAPLSSSPEKRAARWRFITPLSTRFCQVIRQALDKYVSLIPSPGRLPQFVFLLDCANYMMHQRN